MRWILGVLAVVTTIFYGFLYTQPWAESTALWISLLLPLIAIIYCFIALIRLGSEQKDIKAFVWIFIALVGWWIGDVIWSFLGEPDISLADPLYFVGYIAFFIAGYYGLMKVKDKDFLKDDWWKIALGVLVLGVPLVWFTFVNWWEPGLGFIESLVTFGYVIADVFLLIPIVTVAVKALSGFKNKPWIILALSMLVYMIGDIWYVLTYDSFVSPSPIEISWTLGYLGFALALSYVGKKK